MTFISSHWWLWLALIVTGVMVFRVSMTRIFKTLRANGWAGWAFYYTPTTRSISGLLATGSISLVMVSIVLLGLSLIGMVIT